MNWKFWLKKNPDKEKAVKKDMLTRVRDVVLTPILLLVVIVAGGLTIAHATTTPDVVGVSSTNVTSALNMLPATGGRIVLSADTYTFTGTVTRAIDNVIIEGQGDATLINFNGVDPVFTAGGNNWVFMNFKTDAGGINTGATTGWVKQNINVNGTRTSLQTESGLTLTNNSAVAWLTNAGNSRNILLMNTNNDTFFGGVPNRVQYIGRNLGSNEISFFGDDSNPGSGNVKTSYWDSAGALVGDALVDSPAIFLRNAVWDTDTGATRYLGMQLKTVSVTSGASAAQAGYLSIGYGKFNPTTGGYLGSEFLRLNMAAGGANSTISQYDFNMGANKVLMGNFQLLGTAADGGAIEMQNQAGGYTGELIVPKLVVAANGIGFGGTNGQAFSAPNADGWTVLFKARGTGTSLVEIARLVSGTNGGSTGYFQFTLPPKFNTVSTGGNTTSLGTNSPAVTATPNTWASVLLPDGSTGYVPIWK